LLNKPDDEIRILRAESGDTLLDQPDTFLGLWVRVLELFDVRLATVSCLTESSAGESTVSTKVRPSGCDGTTDDAAGVLDDFLGRIVADLRVGQ
jgi:hypothetical protein